MGSASAADLFFCIFVCIIYGYWVDLVCGIGFAAQFWLRIAYLKSKCVWFWDCSVFDILLIVLRMVSIVFRHLFNSSAISWGHQKDAQRKTMQYGGGIWSRSAEGTWLVIKTMSHIAYCLEPIAIGGQGCPGKLFSLISIGFHWFQYIYIYIYIYIYQWYCSRYWPFLGGIAIDPFLRCQFCGSGSWLLWSCPWPWPWPAPHCNSLGGVWRPVAGLSYPFKMMQ